MYRGLRTCHLLTRKVSPLSFSLRIPCEVMLTSWCRTFHWSKVVCILPISAALHRPKGPKRERRDNTSPIRFYLHLPPRSNCPDFPLPGSTSLICPFSSFLSCIVPAKHIPFLLRSVLTPLLNSPALFRRLCFSSGFRSHRRLAYYTTNRDHVSIPVSPRLVLSQTRLHPIKILPSNLLVISK